jgi:hypothetical protein
MGSIVRMIRFGRIWLVALLALAGLAAAAPAADAAFGVKTLVAANCSAGFEECGSVTVPIGPFEYSIPKEPTLAEAKEQGYTQAAGHPAYGITDFEIATVGALPNAAPTGLVTHVRTDVGPGVSTNPEAVEKCSFAEFGAAEAIPGTGLFGKPACKAGSEIGINKVTVYAGEEPFPKGGDLPLEGKVYNLAQPNGLASDFGVALELLKGLTKVQLENGFKAAEAKGAKPGVGGFPSIPVQEYLEAQQYYAHTLIEGHIEWAGDYHDYYEINISPALPLISSRLILKGNIGTGGFITNPSNCTAPGPQTTSTVTLKSAEGEEASLKYTTPIGAEGCGSLVKPIPFKPTFSLTPETTQLDQPDGILTELTLPHDPNPENLDSSQLKTATVTLPEGLTLNPSAAAGLEACTPAELGKGTRKPVACPLGSKIGTVTLDVPDLPPESLRGNLYLGGSESGSISGPPYTMYIDAESAAYGISVRLVGSVVPNETTGRLTATFSENPQQPFSDLVLRFDGGPLAPLANPLVCGEAKTETSLEPYTGASAFTPPPSSFVVDGNGAGGACAASLPFALTQSTRNQPTTAGGSTSYTFTLVRPSGNQELSRVSTVLPAGLLGRVPAVALCSEAQVGESQVTEAACPASSWIGSATVSVGSGPYPYQLTGQVYFTGPYAGAPYGMAVVVPAVAGPFSLGNVVVRASVSVEPYTGRVVVTSVLPTIWKGIPLRLRRVSIEVSRQSFLLNPTSCGTLATESALSGFTPGSPAAVGESIATPFSVTECSTLPFHPTLTASTGAKTSKTNGASLEVNVTQPSGQANVRQVVTTLPPQLPSRLTTLQGACPAATFEVAVPPGACPEGSLVGTATAVTPALPGTLTGPIYIVSHGGAAFPDVDAILRGDGVTVILVGHTNIVGGITTTSFESLPDAPVSSVTLSFPTGPHSILGAVANLCTSNLTMPTTIVGQNGAKITQSTKIAVTECPIQILRHRTSRGTAFITVKTPAAGRISGSGTDLRFVTRKVGKACTATIAVPLTRLGKEVLHKFRRLRIKVRIGFVPKSGHAVSIAHATVTFHA